MLRRGLNRIDLWAEADARTAWAIALEDGHPDPQSFVSNDAGETWQNSRMGSHHVQRGEYVVRLRVGMPAKRRSLPTFEWEQADAPRMADLRRMVPRATQSIADPWRRARAIASWTSRQWRYANTSDGATLYCPWDPWTILDKSGTKDETAGSKPKMIRMCVHYGVLFTCLCLACGIPARAVVCTDSLAGLNGHFVTEVWLERDCRWAMIDPNLDLAFIDRGRPLGIEELYPRRRHLRDFAEAGPGTQFHRPRLGQFLEEQVLTGESFRLSGVWGRNDFLSRPDLTPPAHGQEAFSETDIVWRDRNVRGEELGMFPFVAPDEWFNDTPPAGRFRGVAPGDTRADSQVEHL